MSVVYTMCVPHPPLIIPEIGKGREQEIHKTIESYQEVMKKAASYHPETVIVISPHSIMYSDYLHISPGKHATGNFGTFGASQVSFSEDYDQPFVLHLVDACEKAGIPAGTLGERDPHLDHGTMIPLYFLEKYTHDFQLVRIGISGLSYATHYALGQAIAQTADKLKRRVVVIASGDLSHKLKDDGPYGFAKEGPIFDQEVMQYLAAGDFLNLLSFDYDFCENAAECGLRSFQIMAGTLDGKKIEPHVYSHEGPFGVGYGVVDFTITGNDESRHFAKQLEKRHEEKMAVLKAKEDPYVKLARYTVEYYTKHHTLPDMPDNILDEMKTKRAGVFVSLHKDGQLRGCIGTFQPTCTCIAEEIRQNAISACSRDPRFDPVREEELKDLVYSVDVLGAVEPIEDISQLDPVRYGVIVSHGRKRGLLLPNLPGVSTVMEQIEIARSKAGMYDDEKADLARFEVVRHT